MEKIIAIILIVVCLCLAGCSGHCVRVEGTYEGISGGVEYCFDKAKSDKAGAPVFKDGKGESIFGIGKDTLRKIWDRIRGVEASAVARDDAELMRRILGKLKE